MAAHDETAASHGFVLPVMVASPADVGRLVQELENIGDALLQNGLRQHEAKLSKTSHLMDQLVAANRLDLLQETHRKVLHHFLTDIRQHSPVLHISFSTDPSPGFTEKLMTWLRKEVHPLVLLTIGLQPTIGAGCIVRSTNKQFDFSLRADLLGKRELLMQQLSTPQQAAAQPVQPQEAAV